MVEEAKELLPQSRMEWYRIRQAALDMVRVGESEGIARENLVFIGGLACAFHLEATLGGRQALSWRGTEDIDLAVFGLGNAQRLIGGLKRSSLVDGCQAALSHLPDKWRCQVKPGGVGGFWSEEKSWLEVDLYGQLSLAGIHLNERVLRPNQLIYDPPEELTLGRKPETRVTVPSLRDIIILKFDVLRYSALRLKDQFDILSCLAVAEKKGVSFHKLIKEVFAKIFSQQQKSDAANVCRNLAKSTRERTIPTFWVVPTSSYFKNLEMHLPTK